MSDFKNKVEKTIQEFLKAYYGEEVKEKYAEIARLTCVESMDVIDKKIDEVDDTIKKSERQTLACKKQTENCSDVTEYALEVINKISKELFARDPIDGQKKSVQLVINSLYAQTLESTALPITAIEFDSAGITAKSFTDKKLTRRTFDETAGRVFVGKSIWK